MRLPIKRTTAYYLCLVAALVIVAACNGGGGGGGPAGPSANAPVVSNFKIQQQVPATSRGEGQYLITATVTDPNNDLNGGEVEVSDAGTTITHPIDSGVLQGSKLAVILVTNPVPPGQYPGIFVIVDAAGNRSNESTFVIGVTSERPRGATETPRGGALKRLEPAH